MVSISKGVGRNVLCFFPAQVVHIQQQPHQFSHANRRMGVIELEGKFFMEGFNGIASAEVDFNGVLQRTGDKEILLFQSQFLSISFIVIGIEHLGDILRPDFFVDGPEIVTTVEQLEIKRLVGF